MRNQRSDNLLEPTRLCTTENTLLIGQNKGYNRTLHMWRHGEDAHLIERKVEKCLWGIDYSSSQTAGRDICIVSSRKEGGIQVDFLNMWLLNLNKVLMKTRLQMTFPRYFHMKKNIFYEEKLILWTSTIDLEKGALEYTRSIVHLSEEEQKNTLQEDSWRTAT